MATTSAKKKQQLQQQPTSPKKRKLEVSSIPVISSSDSIQFLVKRLMPHLIKPEEDDDDVNNKIEKKKTHSRKNIIWTEHRKQMAIGVNECMRFLGIYTVFINMQVYKINHTLSLFPLAASRVNF